MCVCVVKLNFSSHDLFSFVVVNLWWLILETPIHSHQVEYYKRKNISSEHITMFSEFNHGFRIHIPSESNLLLLLNKTWNTVMSNHYLKPIWRLSSIFAKKLIRYMITDGTHELFVELHCKFIIKTFLRTWHTVYT